MQLFPRDTSFVDLFTDLAAQGTAAADLLARLLGTAPGPERDAVAAQLADAERRADDVVHALARRTRSSLVVPFDRGDVHALAGALDDCVDAVEAAGQALVAFRPARPGPAVAELVALLQQQAEATERAVRRLPAVLDLADYWVAVNQLENEADRTHRRALAALLDGERDVPELLRAKEVLDALARASRAYEQVATAVQALAAKEA